MEIKEKDYNIHFERDNSTVFFQGFLRLDGIESYQSIKDLLLNCVDKVSNITINMRELEFLNSSGISMLSMFVVEVRNQGNIHLTFQGSNKILWQTRSLKNLQRLMPSIKLEFI